MNCCNLTYLKSISPKSNTFSIQIIQLFLEETPKSINKIKNALDASNWLEVYSNAHKIKASFSLLGLPNEIIVVLLKINEYSKICENLDQIPSLLYFLETELKKVYQELSLELSELIIS